MRLRNGVPDERNAHRNRIPLEGHGSRLMQAFCGVTKWMLTRTASPFTISSGIRFG